MLRKLVMRGNTALSSAPSKLTGGCSDQIANAARKSPVLLTAPCQPSHCAKAHASSNPSNHIAASFYPLKQVDRLRLEPILFRTRQLNSKNCHESRPPSKEYVLWKSGGGLRKGGRDV